MAILGRRDLRPGLNLWCWANFPRASVGRASARAPCRHDAGIVLDGQMVTVAAADARLEGLLCSLRTAGAAGGAGLGPAGVVPGLRRHRIVRVRGGAHPIVHGTSRTAAGGAARLVRGPASSERSRVDRHPRTVHGAQSDNENVRSHALTKAHRDADVHRTPGRLTRNPRYGRARGLLRSNLSSWMKFTLG